MTRGTRLFPYATVDDAAVTWDAWWLEIAGERVPLPKYAPGWDYASHLVVGLTATIDEETALSSTGLDQLDQLAIVLVADCKASQRRFITTEVLLTGANSVELRREIPPGEVADSLSLSAALRVGARPRTCSGPCTSRGIEAGVEPQPHAHPGGRSLPFSH